MGWAKPFIRRTRMLWLEEWRRLPHKRHSFRPRIQDSDQTGHYRWFPRSRGRKARRGRENRCVWYASWKISTRGGAPPMLCAKARLVFVPSLTTPPVMMLGGRPHRRQSFFNRFVLETTGQTEAEALGFGWVDVIHPDDRSDGSGGILQRDCRQGTGAQRVPAAASRWKLGMGDRCRATALFRRRNVPGIRGLGSRITERRAAEVATQEAQAFIRSIFDSSPDCVACSTWKGDRCSLNEAGRRLFGLHEGAPVTGQTWDSIGRAPTPTRSRAAGKASDAGRQRVSRFPFGMPAVKKDAWTWIRPRSRTIEEKPFRILSYLARHYRCEASKRPKSVVRKGMPKPLPTNFSSVLESTMDSVMLLDADWRVRYLNENARKLLQVGDEALGRVFWKLFPEEEKGSFAKHCREVMDRRVRSFFEDHLSSLGRWVEAKCLPDARRHFHFSAET